MFLLQVKKKKISHFICQADITINFSFQTVIRKCQINIFTITCELNLKKQRFDVKNLALINDL